MLLKRLLKRLLEETICMVADEYLDFTFSEITSYFYQRSHLHSAAERSYGNHILFDIVFIRG